MNPHPDVRLMVTLTVLYVMSVFVAVLAVVASLMIMGGEAP